MMVGALIFLVAGAIESRKARFIRARLEAIRSVATAYFGNWK